MQKRFKRILEKIAPLNQKFLEIVTEAFSEIIHETGRRWDGVPYMMNLVLVAPSRGNSAGRRLLSGISLC